MSGEKSYKLGKISVTVNNNHAGYPYRLRADAGCRPDADSRPDASANTGPYACTNSHCDTNADSHTRAITFAHTGPSAGDSAWLC